jgi:plastocyanin
MKRWIGGFLAVIALLVSATGAWADGKVIITREENKPATVEIKAGQDVVWISATGGVAHIAFVGNDAVQFYVGGKGGGRARFDRAGTYDYVVHVSGVKGHAHRGTVVVK